MPDHRGQRYIVTAFGQPPPRAGWGAVTQVTVGAIYLGRSYSWLPEPRCSMLAAGTHPRMVCCDLTVVLCRMFSFCSFESYGIGLFL
jgi:hypothetical protein